MAIRNSRRCNNSQKKNTTTNSLHKNDIHKDSTYKNNIDRSDTSSEGSMTEESKSSVDHTIVKKKEKEKVEGPRRSARLKEIYEVKDCNTNQPRGRVNGNAQKQKETGKNGTYRKMVIKKENNIKNEDGNREQKGANRKVKGKKLKEPQRDHIITQKKRNNRSETYSKEITNTTKRRKGDNSGNIEKKQNVENVISSPKKEIGKKSNKNNEATKMKNKNETINGSIGRERTMRNSSKSSSKKSSVKKGSNTNSVEKKEAKLVTKKEPSERTKVDFFEKTLKKRKLGKISVTINVRKNINKIIKECIQKITTHKNYKNNNKFNIFTYGKGNVLYYLERIRYREGSEIKSSNFKLSGKSERIKVSKSRFRIGSSQKLCDLVIKDDIEKEQCLLICQCVERNINKATYEHEQIHKYHLFIMNRSENNSTILNDECVPFDQVKNEDYIYLGVENANHKINSKYIYRVRFNTLPRILKYNYNHSSKNMNFDVHRKGTSGGVMSYLGRSRSDSVQSNFSLLNLVSENHLQENEGMLCLGSVPKGTLTEADESENTVVIVVFRIIERSNESNKNRIYRIQMNSFGSLNSTPRKSVVDQGKLQRITSISVGKIVKAESTGKAMDDSFMDMKNICQSRLSPLSMRGSVKKEEKNKNNLGMIGFGKGLPVTLLNACAELCKESPSSPQKIVTTHSDPFKTNIDTGENDNEDLNLSSLKKEKNNETAQQIQKNINNIFLSAFKSEEDHSLINEPFGNSLKNGNDTVNGIINENTSEREKKSDSFQGSSVTTTSKEITDLLELQKEDHEEGVLQEASLDIHEFDKNNAFSVNIHINEPVEHETIVNDQNINNAILENINIETYEKKNLETVENVPVETVEEDALIQNNDNINNEINENINTEVNENMQVEKSENKNKETSENINIENNENVNNESAEKTEVENIENSSKKKSENGNVENKEKVASRNTDNANDETVESAQVNNMDHIHNETVENLKIECTTVQNDEPGVDNHRTENVNIENEIIEDGSSMVPEYFDIPSEDGQKESIDIHGNEVNKNKPMEKDSILLNIDRAVNGCVIESNGPLFEHTTYIMDNSEEEKMKSQNNEIRNHLNNVEYLNEGLSTDTMDKVSEENNNLNEKSIETHAHYSKAQPTNESIQNNNEESYISQVVGEEVGDSNQSIYFECHEEVECSTPVKYITEETMAMIKHSNTDIISIENNEKEENEEVEPFREHANETKQDIDSFTTNKKNVSKDYILCLKNENGIEQYVKMIGEIEVKRNSNLSEIIHLIDSKLLDTTTEKKVLPEEGNLNRELANSKKKYTVHLDPFSEKSDEDKFNECSALHLDYIDKSTFSDLEIFESSKLKKMLFIKYVEE